MNKFNLTFNGEILAGKDPEQVKLGFADMFGIDDPVRLARFFSGKTIVLRRNLERKDAAQLYHQLQLLGAVAALVKVTASDMADEIARNSAREAAALEAQKRQAAEEEARRKAIEEARIAEQERLAEEQRAKEAAEAARLAAEKAARKAEEAAERKRLEEAEAARKKTLKAAAKRKAADEAAKRKARRIQEKARLKAEREEEQRLAAEEEARVKAELEESKRLAAEEEARRRAAEQEMEQRLAALQKKRQEAVAAPIASKIVEPPPSADKVQPRARRPGKATVKTTLDVPLRTRGSTPEVGTPGQRKHSSGAPNLYKLRPFRNSEEVRTRSERARQRMRQAYTAGMFALAVLLITGGSFLQNADYPVVTGASAVAINANSEPLLLADDLLLVHDRAGVATTEVTLRELGVTALQPPLLYNSADQLLAHGQLLDKSETNQFLQCDLVRSSCTLFSTQLQNNSIDAFAINPLDDSLLLADTTAGQLLKVSREGELLSSAATAIPGNPVLRLRGGLLLMNSAEGPAISVFRYEDNAFGQQLDEILLLPPTALQLELSRVSDFVWSGDAWWVYLRDTASGAGELHRFDENWNYLSSVPLATAKGPVQLISWGSKTLVNDPTQPSIQRYNAEGEVEAPFDSTLLAELIDAQRQRASFASTAWHGALLTCAVAVLLLFGFGYLHGLRDLVYRSKREQGAEPLDDHAAALHWIEPVQNRQLHLRRTAMRYGGAALLILVLAIMLSVSAWQLGALLLALSGPAIALLLLSRQPVGHIGVLGDRLLLVDHSGQYHLAGGPRLHYCGPFLLIDDIVVYCGSRLLPAFSPASLQRHISPTALGGIKVDYKTIAIKLLESQHPLALGVLAIAAGVAAAILLLILQRVF